MARALSEGCLGAGDGRLRHLDGGLGRRHVVGVGRRHELRQLRLRRSPRPPWLGQAPASGPSCPAPPGAGPLARLRRCRQARCATGPALRKTRDTWSSGSMLPVALTVLRICRARRRRSRTSAAALGSAAGPRSVDRRTSRPRRGRRQHRKIRKFHAIVLHPMLSSAICTSRCETGRLCVICTTHLYSRVAQRGIVQSDNELECLGGGLSTPNLFCRFDRKARQVFERLDQGVVAVAAQALGLQAPVELENQAACRARAAELSAASSTRRRSFCCRSTVKPGRQSRCMTCGPRWVNIQLPAAPWLMAS